jgi:cobalamin biosynthesis protein CobD/CbiB
MRKLITTLSIAAMMLASTPVLAQYRHNHGYQPRQHHYVAPRPAARHRNNNWVPYALGGLALGALGGAYYYNNRQCWDEMIGYDRYGREVFERYCR